MKRKSVAIIGGGPAGVASAIQLKRNRIDFYLFEKNRIGGLLRNASIIENYPGFFQNITGIGLSNLLLNHLKKLSIDFINEKVEALTFDHNNDCFIIRTNSGKYFSNYIIGATGTVPLFPKIFNDSTTKIKKKIYFDITEIVEIENRSILIVGSGDAAFDYAVTLSKSNKVKIAVRKRNIKALELLVKKVLSESDACIKTDTEVISVIDGDGDKLLVTFSEACCNRQEEFDIIVFAIGRRPDDKIFLSLLKKNKLPDYLKEKIIFIGDLKNSPFRQAAIAAGDGLKAAMILDLKLRKK